MADHEDPVQLAGLTESAIDTLLRLVKMGGLPGASPAIPGPATGAAVLGKLSQLLDHITGTLTSPGIQDSLPNEAAKLDGAGRSLTSAASMISAEAHRTHASQPASSNRSLPSRAMPALTADYANPFPLADLAISAAQALHRQVTIEGLRHAPQIPADSAAAAVVSKLRQAVDHIADTLTTQAISNALPHSARGLQGAVARLTSVVPVMSAGTRPPRQVSEFPQGVARRIPTAQPAAASSRNFRPRVTAARQAPGQAGRPVRRAP